MTKDPRRHVGHRMTDSLRGLSAAVADEPSVRFHLAASVVALVLLGWAQPPAAFLLTAIVLLVTGLALELVNGAIEDALDVLHPDRHPAIGRAKDKASAAALVVNVAAALVVLAALTA